MKRRSFVVRACAALASALFAAGVRAAPTLVGFLAPKEEPRYTNLVMGLRQGLEAEGMGPSKVTLIEHAVPRGQAAMARAAAHSLDAARVAVVFVVGTELAKVIRSVSLNLPIVMITPGDPVQIGLAASLSRPGNNLTGMTFEFTELSAKRLELLKEILPSAQRVGVVFDRRDGSPRRGFAAALEAARVLALHLVEIDADELIRGTNAASRAGRFDAMLLIPGGAATAALEAASKLAATQRIPIVGWARSAAVRDAVLTYGVSDVEVARSAARLLVKIINGHPAGELPIEQPTRFHFSVNMKSAKALGLVVPLSVLLCANEVLE